MTENLPHYHYEINGETIFPFLVYGRNRSENILHWHQKVYEHLDLPMNYFEFPFPAISHGAALNDILGNFEVLPDYFLLTEMDCVPLVNNIFEIVYDKIKDKNTIFGHAQESNHIKKRDGTTNSPYAGPGFLSFSTELYQNLGRPTLDHSDQYDCAENLTNECQRRGYNVCLSYPREVYLKNCKVGQNAEFGMGNNFGGIIYHVMCQNHSESENLFVQKCQEIVREGR